MLELKGITKHWANRALFSDVHLSVESGETVALLGPSGSGKSTMLGIVAGLESADAGSVWMSGVDITLLAPEKRRLAMMFQDFALFPHLNVEDNVAFGLVEQRVRKAQARERARAMLDRFGLSHVHKAKIWTLSGGEQQRVALARALITEPKGLLLDEPFSALDADLRSQLRQEFRQRIDTSGMFALLVTHDEEEAKVMAGRAWRLVDGRLHRLW